MQLLDWATRLDPAVEAHRPCRVWLPPAPAPSPPPAAARDAADRRPPRAVPVGLCAADAADLARRVPAVLDPADCRAGDTVTVDLALAAPQLTGLGLLLAALWRRVGPAGSVALIGVSDAVRTTLARLGLTPDAVRASVFGQAVPLRDTPRDDAGALAHAALTRGPVPRPRPAVAAAQGDSARAPLAAAA